MRRRKSVPVDEHDRVCRERDQLYRVLREMMSRVPPAAVKVWTVDGTRVIWALYDVHGAAGGIVLERHVTGTGQLLQVSTLDAILSREYHGDVAIVCAAARGELARVRQAAYDADTHRWKIGELPEGSNTAAKGGQ